MPPSSAATDLNELLAALEQRVRRAVKAVDRLRDENARLAGELASAAARLGEWERRGAGWERERDALGARLERLLQDIDSLARTQEEHDRVAPSGATP
jgi:chromosome segregation ATPase